MIEYEAALKADAFLVMALGATAEIARTKAVLATASASCIDVHASRRFRSIHEEKIRAAWVTSRRKSTGQIVPTAVRLSFNGLRELRKSVPQPEIK